MGDTALSQGMGDNMAGVFKYFSGKQEISVAPWPMRNATFRACFPETKGVRYDSFTMQVVCDGLEILPVTRIIEYSRTPSLHKCDARCRHAKGRNCECSCGGKNHGAGD